MIRRAAALAAVLVLSPVSAYAGTGGTVTPEEYAAAHAGQSRTRVQHDFDTAGTRVLMYATDEFRVLVKDYPGDDGETYRLTFRSGLCSCGPYAGPYTLHVKRQDPGA
jgi:hypothetical protein